jgi:hypothetical protein
VELGDHGVGRGEPGSRDGRRSLGPDPGGGAW